MKLTMKKRIIPVTLAAAMAASTLAGCGSKTQETTTTTAGDTKKTVETTEKKEEQITLTVSSWDVAANAATDPNTSIDNLFRLFEASHPNIKVNIVDIPSSDYTSKLSIMLNGGNDIDLVLIKDADTTPALAEKGQLEDLDPYIERDSVDVTQYLGHDYFNYGGTQYALTNTSSFYVLYYNKDIFDAAGVEYPSNDMTWKEFEELAAKVTSGEGSEKKYGAFLHSWQACVENWAVQDGKNTIMGPDYGFMKPAYEMALRMQDAGTIMDYSTIKTGNIHYSGPFSQGTIAMMPMGSWFATTMMNKVKVGESSVNWGIATIPHPEGMEAGYTVGAVGPVAINSKSKNKDAAWELVKFMCGPEGAEFHAGIGQFPALIDETAINVISSLPGMPEGAKEALVTKNIALDRPLDPLAAAVNQMLGEEHSLIMIGEVSVDEGLTEMGERSREIQGK